MRKETFINLTDDGRELTFKIRQMPALKQERWVNRVLMLVLGGGGLNNLKMEKLSAKLKKGDYSEVLGVLSTLKYENVEPLYSELLECCEHVPDAGNRNFTIPMNNGNVDSVVSDFKNLYRLRVEALKINFDFFGKGENSPTQNKAATIRITKNM